MLFEDAKNKVDFQAKYGYELAVSANFQTQFGLDWGPMTALAAVYSIPVILLTLLLQRKIVAGMTLGAVRASHQQRVAYW